jgi:flagellar hook protein FlgE
MKRSYSILLLPITLAVALQLTAAQAPRHSLTASIESRDKKLQVHLTNSDNLHEFQGTAKISVGSPSTTNETINVEVKLAPGETRLVQLDFSAPPGEQYTLTIYNKAGALVLIQVAFIKQTADPFSPSAGQESDRSTKQADAQTEANDLRIEAQLSRISPNSEAEIQIPDEAPPYLLTCSLVAKTPIVNANLTISAKDFKRVQQVTVQGQTKVSFNLPDELIEKKLRYDLTDSAGKLLISGEVDLDQLAHDDSTSISSFKLDRPSYLPGDTVRAVIELQSESSRGYRLQVAAKKGTDIFFEDERRGASRSRQEFTFELPREVQGAIVFEYKVFGRQTGMLFDSGSRIIALSDESTKGGNAGGGSSISPF